MIKDLNGVSKNLFIQQAEDEFKKFSKCTDYRKPSYSLKNAVTDAVTEFQKEHGRWPKVFEFLLYTSRMFAKHSPNKTNDSYCIKHVKNGTVLKMGNFFARIADNKIQGTLNRIAYDLQRNGPVGSKWEKNTKLFFENIQVYPDNLYYQDFKEKLPEYIMLRDGSTIKPETVAKPKEVKVETSSKIKTKPELTKVISDATVNYPTPKSLLSGFKKIIDCRKCSNIDRILCDDHFNLPQPGYVGKNYAQRKILLVAQNPGVCAPDHKFYPLSLRYADLILALQQKTNNKNFGALNNFLADFIAQWPVYQKFPSREAGVSINDIAYINLVHCRTKDNQPVPKQATHNCIEAHFEMTLDLLQPKVVIVLGKHPYSFIEDILDRKNIPNTYINRLRNLPAEAREKNRSEIIELLKV